MSATGLGSFQKAKALASQGEAKAAWEVLRMATRPEDDFSVQHRHIRLFNSISGQLGLTPLKIGVVATSTAEHFVDAFRFWLAREGFLAEVCLAEFNTLDQTLLDAGSELYAFAPDFIWLFTNHRDIQTVGSGCTGEHVGRRVLEEVERFKGLWGAIQANSSAYIMQNNVEIPLERVFGNYEGSVGWSRVNFLRRFNLALADALEPGVSILDVDFISSVYGKRAWFDERYWYHSKHAFSLDASGLLAFQAARLIRGIKGQAKKCLVLDLDNTLWGGVIGDDGLEGIRLGNGADGEAFVDFQRYVRSLKQRGIVLAVCSKNEEENAKLPFKSHPDMQLSLEDIAVFVANWDDKASNIKAISEVLGLGLDSLVFFDDNPVERELVRTLLPEVAVPDLPEDPTLYVRVLDEKRYFETGAFSSEDTVRGDMYRENALRSTLKARHNNLSEYLQSLEMEAHCAELDPLHLPRIAQLINKSNQFHLTTTRYTEAQLREMAAAEDVAIRFIKLRDKFGDNGLISVFILKRVCADTLFVDTWVMSCRVLSRGVEEYAHNMMVEVAQKCGASTLLGKYIPTKKNRLVAELYPRLGYSPVMDEGEAMLWRLELSGENVVRPHFIRDQKACPA